jgi:hypothetical protein
VHRRITLVDFQRDAFCILRSLASWVVTDYFYVDIGWYYLFDPAGFIIPDGCMVFIKFCFDFFCIGISVLLVQH